MLCIDAEQQQEKFTILLPKPAPLTTAVANKHFALLNANDSYGERDDDDVPNTLQQQVNIFLSVLFCKTHNT